MEYTIKKLGNIAGISTRTLRYYDEIGILKPTKINSSGYRIYGEEEVNRLQQILFYKELDLELEEIGRIINLPDFDEIKALKSHKEKLLAKRSRLDLLIANVEKTLQSKKGGKSMSDKEKFEGFKENLIKENEEKYGKEVREKYGDDAVNKSNAKLQNMTEEEYKEVTGLSNEIMETLKQAFELKDPTSELAQKVAELHKKWLCFYWDKYSKEAHLNLANGYVEDERFRKYYDIIGEGATEFLRDAIKFYISK